MMWRLIRLPLPQLLVLHHQIVQFALEQVDPDPLGLDQALLVLHDRRQLLQIQHRLDGVLKQTGHDFYNTSAFGSGQQGSLTGLQQS